MNQYRKGADKERKLVNEARNTGKIAFRSAGSKSPIDVVTVDSVTREIELIQSKVNQEAIRSSLERKYGYLNGIYTVRFVVK